MTSPQLIVLVDREGNHCVLAILPFILGLWPHPIQWEWGNIGITGKLLEFGVFPFILPSHGPRLSSFHFIYRGIYLALVSARLGITLDSLWECLSSLGVMDQAIRLLRLKKVSPAGPGEQISYPHSAYRNGPEAENPNGSIILLMLRLAGKFRGSLRGLTCSINVSAQH